MPLGASLMPGQEVEPASSMAAGMGRADNGTNEGDGQHTNLPREANGKFWLFSPPR